MFLRKRAPRSVEVETDLGPLSLPAYDAVIAPWMRQYGTWEPEVTSLLRRLLAPGMTFVDLGAHVGYHTLVGAHAVGPDGTVVALEPEPRNFALLQANLARAGATNVRTLRIAAWDRSGHLKLTLSGDNSGDHRVAPVPGAHRRIRIRGVALDDLLPSNATVDVVKSDLQGADHVAIHGMERRIAHSSPVVVAEFWPEGIVSRGDDPLDVLAYYRGLGFALTMVEDPRITPGSTLQEILAAARAAEGAFCTLLLEPKDRP